ncbi:hypothetical protein B1J93_18830 [Leptospira kirschneri serovar Pomona]|uniref:Uncharacterized protein n=1 Tax=Leptospira kirschneri serovar Pomona TaxID=561005 RepID=A0A1T1DGI6_9LEPT|nr:hypothetical protein B1J93_18830 [Leptospira kirschneri serovar Pomona]
MSPPPPPPKNKGGNSVLQRICRNSHRFNIEIQILVGRVMTLHGSFEVTQRLASTVARQIAF